MRTFNLPVSSISPDLKIEAMPSVLKIYQESVEKPLKDFHCHVVALTRRDTTTLPHDPVVMDRHSCHEVRFGGTC